MSKLAVIIASCFIFFVACFLPVSASAQEHIEDFTQTTNINTDGTVDITENILYDFGSNTRHGIYRDIPYIKTNNDGKRYSMNIKVDSVTDEEEREHQYAVSRDGGTLRIKIGDPDKTITGMHTYKIQYKASGALTYFEDHDELYWNITGNNWTVPITYASSTITLPSAVSTEDVKGVCYTGYFGSIETDCDVSVSGDSVTINSLNSYPISSGLTVAVSFPKNVVAVLEPTEVINFSDTWYGKIIIFLITLTVFIAAVLWYIFLPLRIGWKWLTQGRDPSRARVARAWYDPPRVSGRFLTASETGTVVDESVDFDDISAMVVQLAQKGYFKIVETSKKNFSFVKMKDYNNDASLMSFEHEFLSSAFATETEVALKRAELYGTIQKVEGMIYDQTVKDKIFPENPKKIRTLYAVLAILGITTLNIPLFISSLLFGLNMPRRTELGVQALGEAQSLQNFLTSQSRQIKYQGEKQLLFEKLLPYAIAFRVESEWAKRFEDLKLPPPDWYQPYDSSSFRSAMFIGSLHNSMAKLQTAASPPATSSSSGFSSGSSGGSSGGGGGGGGGGSW